ncbi:Pseudokinase FAM20A [Dissostichus eleginoides]|uniref:Pseudokinase FAM20A n=1 Tax=Dissostichus eleginoides TaxID=100907 RepID=A0AAD9BC65_DISEL|nr:Pseudokinase FAM20A [Dissostichus eleginoides]
MMRRDRLLLAATLTAIFSADLYFVLLPKLRSAGLGSGDFCPCGSDNFTLPRHGGLATPQLSNWTLYGTTFEPADDGGSKLERLFSHPLYNIETPVLGSEESLLQAEQLMEYYRRKVARWERHMHLYSESAALSNITVTEHEVTFDPEASWLKFHSGISSYALYSRNDPAIPKLLKDMQRMSVISADYTQDEKALKGACDCTQVVKPSGHHLKLALKMQNFGKAMFKPMRHNAEIAAFHLDRILDFRRVPPVAGRLVNVSGEVLLVTHNEDLRAVFFTSPANNTCFFAKCLYVCKTEYAVCGGPDLLEGSLSAYLPSLSIAPRISIPNPWTRSYTFSRREEWEVNPFYCDTVKQQYPITQETGSSTSSTCPSSTSSQATWTDTIMRFLLNLGTMGSSSTWTMHGCCMIKRSTLVRLQLLARPEFRLSDVMRESLKGDSLQPVLTEPHLLALDRRLQKVLRAVQRCVRRLGEEDVITKDFVKSTATPQINTEMKKDR